MGGGGFTLLSPIEDEGFSGPYELGKAWMQVRSVSICTFVPLQQVN